MRTADHKKGQSGFSLIEMMIAAAIFILLCGAAFALLSLAQQRYQTESQVLNSFQEARFALDDIVRDINGAGFPSPSEFSFNPTAPQSNFYASTPVAWAPGYGTNTPCQIGTAGGGTCNPTPGDFDLIIERNPNPLQQSFVLWTRYQLSNNVLSRGQAEKTTGTGADPDGSTSTTFVPYVQNVMNNASGTEIALFRTTYPQMFPGGNPVPVFSYFCYTPAGTQPCPSAAAPYNEPVYVTDIEVTLIVMAPTKDAQTGAPRLIELHGRGHSVNTLQ